MSDAGSSPKIKEVRIDHPPQFYVSFGAAPGAKRRRCDLKCGSLACSSPEYPEKKKLKVEPAPGVPTTEHVVGKAGTITASSSDCTKSEEDEQKKQKEEEEEEEAQEDKTLAYVYDWRDSDRAKEILDKVFGHCATPPACEGSVPVKLEQEP